MGTAIFWLRRAILRVAASCPSRMYESGGAQLMLGLEKEIWESLDILNFGPR